MRTRPTCSVQFCTNPHFGHGYCNKHYRRWRLSGDPKIMRQPPQPRMNQLNQVDAAWVAGLFEGEGSIANPGGRPVLLLGMTDEDVVHKFAAILGTGRVHIYDPPNPLHKRQYRWNRGGREFTTDFFQATHDFLGARRYARFVEVLDPWPF